MDDQFLHTNPQDEYQVNHHRPNRHDYRANHQT